MGILSELALVYEEPSLERGYVYVMEFRFRNKLGNVKVLYKVGVTKNKPIDRMLDIGRSFFMKRRYVPECRLVRFRKIVDYYGMETTLHKLLVNYRYDFGKLAFDGCTEYFDIPLDNLLAIYDEAVPLVKDKTLVSKMPP